MRYTLKMPIQGDTTREVFITEWLVAVGQTVAVGDVLLTAETDKAAVEVPTPFAGVLIEQLVAPEDEVEIGAPFAVIEG